MDSRSTRRWGMNALRTVGGGAFGHKDVPKRGAISCGQFEEAWKLWKKGIYGDVSLSDGAVEYAETHEEINDALLRTFLDGAEPDLPQPSSTDRRRS